MIQHIDVHAVLQQSIPGIDADLVTRPTGRVVRERISQALAAANGTWDLGGPDAPTIACMDFTGVRCIDYSCADEIVAKLLRERAAVLVFRGISEGHRDTIEPVLAWHGLAALLELPDGTLDAVGAPEAAASLLDELVGRHCVVCGPGGRFTLTLA